MFLAIDEYRTSWWKLLHASKTKFFSEYHKIKSATVKHLKNQKTKKTHPKIGSQGISTELQIIYNWRQLTDSKECSPQLKVYILKPI